MQIVRDDASRPGFILASAGVDYRAQARYGDEKPVPYQLRDSLAVSLERLQGRKPHCVRERGKNIDSLRVTRELSD